MAKQIMNCHTEREHNIGGMAMSLNSATQVDTQAAINCYSLEEIMSEDLLTAYEGWSVKRLARFFVKHDISAVPVVAADDELVGVASLSDVIKFNSRERTSSEMSNLVWTYSGLEEGGLNDDDIQHLKDRAIETCTVNSLMTPNVISADIDTSVVDVCAQLIRNDVHHIFVTKNQKLAGVVTAMDVLRAMMDS